MNSSGFNTYTDYDTNQHEKKLSSHLQDVFEKKSQKLVRCGNPAKCA